MKNNIQLELSFLFSKISEDCNRITSSTSNGFFVFDYDIVTLTWKVVIWNEEIFGGLKIIDSYQTSSLLLICSSGITPGTSPRKLKLWNFIERKLVFDKSFQTSVVWAKFNRNFLTIGLSSCIHIFQLPDMSLIKTIITRSDSSISLLQKSILLYPSEAVGMVSIFDCMTLKLINSISAHKSDVIMMNTNENTNLLATASVKGTIIRIFSLPSGQNIYSYRNSMLPAQVISIEFCKKSQFLFVSSISNHNLDSFINLFLLKSDQVNELIVAKAQYDDNLDDGYCNVQAVPPVGGLSPSVGSKQPISIFEWVTSSVSKILVGNNNNNEISTNFNDSVQINPPMYYSSIKLGKHISMSFKYFNDSDIYPNIYIVTEKGIISRFSFPTSSSQKDFANYLIEEVALLQMNN